MCVTDVFAPCAHQTVCKRDGFRFTPAALPLAQWPIDDRLCPPLSPMGISIAVCVHTDNIHESSRFLDFWSKTLVWWSRRPLPTKCRPPNPMRACPPHSPLSIFGLEERNGGGCDILPAAAQHSGLRGFVEEGVMCRMRERGREETTNCMRGFFLSKGFFDCRCGVSMVLDPSTEIGLVGSRQLVRLGILRFKILEKDFGFSRTNYLVVDGRGGLRGKLKSVVVLGRRRCFEECGAFFTY